MPKLSLICLALLVLAAPAGAAEFNAVSSKEAIRAIVGAGYSGVGGVTRNDPYYFAAAISPAGKRVRVAVDIRTGAIANVTPLPRGAGSLAVTGGAPSSFEGARVEAQPLPANSYYRRPPPVNRRIGVPSYPYNSYNKPAPLWCRDNGFAPGC
jgi:hypothetical protein